MSNEGMALISDFRFQISNLLRGNRFSRIGFRDFDVAFLDSKVNCRGTATVDYLVNRHPTRRRLGRQWEIIEIISDLSMHSVREQMESCFGWQKDPRVPLHHIYLRREFFLFPPIVTERERAPAHCKIQVRETIPGDNPAVV
jgi:hypothetical protein